MGGGNGGRVGDEHNPLARLFSERGTNEGGENVQTVDFGGGLQIDAGYTTHIRETMRENMASNMNWGSMKFQVTARPSCRPTLHSDATLQASPAPLQSVIGVDAATPPTQEWHDMALRSFTSTKDQPWQLHQITDTQCSSGETGTCDTGSPIDQAWPSDMQHGAHPLQQPPNRAVSLPANLPRTSSGTARIHNDRDDVPLDARARGSSLPQEDMRSKSSADLDHDQKEKRRKCNRDSARRVKQRKEEHLKDLEKKVTTLSVEKEIMDKKYAGVLAEFTRLSNAIPLLVHQCRSIQAQNITLRQAVQMRMQAPRQPVSSSRDADLPQPVSDHRHPAGNMMAPSAPLTPGIPQTSSMDQAYMQGIPSGSLQRVSSGFLDSFHPEIY